MVRATRFDDGMNLGGQASRCPPYKLREQVFLRRVDEALFIRS